MPDIIDTLSALDDNALMAKLGYTKKAEAVKADLAEAAKLDPAARKLVAERIEEMMTPNIYPDSIEYAIRDARRQTSKPTTKGEAMTAGDQNDPASLMD